MFAFAAFSALLILPFLLPVFTYSFTGFVCTRLALCVAVRLLSCITSRANAPTAYSLSSFSHSMKGFSFSCIANSGILLHPSRASHCSMCCRLYRQLCLWHMSPTPKWIVVLLLVVACIISAMILGMFTFGSKVFFSFAWFIDGRCLPCFGRLC